MGLFHATIQVNIHYLQGTLDTFSPTLHLTTSCSDCIGMLYSYTEERQTDSIMAFIRA